MSARSVIEGVIFELSFFNISVCCASTSSKEPPIGSLLCVRAWDGTQYSGLGHSLSALAHDISSVLRSLSSCNSYRSIPPLSD